jgi:hypothetical protein
MGRATRFSVSFLRNGTNGASFPSVWHDCRNENALAICLRTDSASDNSSGKSYVKDRTSAALSVIDLPAVAEQGETMSVLEQLLFAVVGVTILAASLALSDPHFGLVTKRESAANTYTLQSCN